MPVTHAIITFIIAVFAVIPFVNMERNILQHVNISWIKNKYIKNVVYLLYALFIVWSVIILLAAIDIFSGSLVRVLMGLK